MSDTPMIRCGALERSHDEVQARAARICGGLKAMGIASGDNVAIVMTNSVEFLEVTAGVALAGANPVPVNWHGKADEIGYLLSNSGSKAAFVHSDFIAAVQQSGCALPVIVARGAAPLPDDHPEYESWLAGHDPDPEPAAPTSGLGMIYTSGTTGKPKGIVRDLV
jgi:long-chain acyl-CoA synthetase